MRHNPFEIVRMFEETVADYTGAPYAVSSNYEVCFAVSYSFS